MPWPDLSAIDGLLQYASPRQADLLNARKQCETWTYAIAAVGMDYRNAKRTIENLEKRAARSGYAPAHDMKRTAPPGYEVRGVSTLYNSEGDITAQWVKTQTLKEQQQEILLQRIEDAVGSHKRFKPTKGPKSANEDLLSLLTITDFHLGMYAFAGEAGEDWDITIARDVLLNAVHDLIDAAPKSETGVLNQLGDFLHWDGLLAVTPTSKHVLDADTRYGKLVDLAMDVMAETVRLMLRKFPTVKVIQAEGNHDEVGSIWLRKHLKHLFADEPRVTVDDSDFPYYAMLHGETMLGFHHGHKMKLAQLHKLFASEPRFRAMWGQAKHTYIHAGHLHHEKVIEDGGAIAEQHPTLAARDAYAARGGWVSMRGAKIITYHKIEGETHRVTVRPRLC